uniref:Uncharacterized protein n=1 Tax=Lepeophtheirus salmonis TaxID=72036 RepID=A0A0K2TNP1_LEPSM
MDPRLHMVRQINFNSM